MQPSDPEDLHTSSPSDLEEDDGNHDSRGPDKGLNKVVNKLIPDRIGKDIEKICQAIYPLHYVFFPRKNKNLVFELGKLWGFLVKVAVL